MVAFPFFRRKPKEWDIERIIARSGYSPDHEVPMGDLPYGHLSLEELQAAMERSRARRAARRAS